MTDHKEDKQNETPKGRPATRDKVDEQAIAACGPAPDKQRQGDARSKNGDKTKQGIEAAR